MRVTQGDKKPVKSSQVKSSFSSRFSEGTYMYVRTYDVSPLDGSPVRHLRPLPSTTTIHELAPCVRGSSRRSAIAGAHSIGFRSFVRFRALSHTHKPRKGVRGRRSRRHTLHTLTGASLKLSYQYVALQCRVSVPAPPVFLNRFG
jgi:hypothetical protein